MENDEFEKMTTALQAKGFKVQPCRDPVNCTFGLKCRFLHVESPPIPKGLCPGHLDGSC